MRKPIFVLVSIVLLAMVSMVCASESYWQAWSSETLQGHLLTADLNFAVNHELIGNNSSYLINGVILYKASFPTTLEIQFVRISAIDSKGQKMWTNTDYGFSPQFIQAGYWNYETFKFVPWEKMEYDWNNVTQIKVEARAYDYSKGDTIILAKVVPFTP